MGDLVCLLGGSHDGEIMRVDFYTGGGVIVFDVTPEVRFDSKDDPMLFPLSRRYEVYHAHKYATPDGWVQMIMTHQSLTWGDLEKVPESQIVKMIMEVWREYWRRKAQECLAST